MTIFRSARRLIAEINNNKPKAINYKQHFLTLDNEQNKYIEENSKNYISLDVVTGKVKEINFENDIVRIEKTKIGNNHLYLDTEDIISYFIENKASVRDTAKYFNTTPQTISNRLKKANNPMVNKLLKENKSKAINKRYDFSNDIISILDKKTRGEWRIEPLDGDEVDKLTEEIRNKLNEVNGNL